MTLTITVIEAAQGAGKTEFMRTEAIKTGGLYVFACPTIELIREQVQWIKNHNPDFHVEEVHSKVSRQKGVLEEADFRRRGISEKGVADAIIYITHETLMSADFSAFKNWHLRIDEVPLAVQSGKIGANESRALYSNIIRLGASMGHWGQYHSVKKTSHKKISRDDALSKNGEFFKQVQRPTGVFINDTHWQDTNELRWFSVWSPSYLSAFSTVQIAASNYMNSLGVRAIKEFHPKSCNFVTHSLARVRTGQPDIQIFYFTDSHKGTTDFWDTSRGRMCIKEVSDYLSQNVPDLGFWSANELVFRLMEHRVPGEHIPPKAMGLNKFRDLTKCAFVYSEKPQDSDLALKIASDITDAEIQDAREFETIRQFVLRGKIRDLAYAGDYAIYVYAKEQAEMLRDHFMKSGFQSVSVAPISLPTVSTLTVAKKPREMSAEDKLTRKRQLAVDRQKKHRNKLATDSANSAKP